ncbi:MAG: hypothetical protein WDN49_01530 [Acetobacteraceae bacterium]
MMEALRSYDEWRLVLFAVLLLLTVRFARNGLLPLLLHPLTRRLRTRRVPIRQGRLAP